MSGDAAERVDRPRPRPVIRTRSKEELRALRPKRSLPSPKALALVGVVVFVVTLVLVRPVHQIEMFEARRWGERVVALYLAHRAELEAGTIDPTTVERMAGPHPAAFDEGVTIGSGLVPGGAVLDFAVRGERWSYDSRTDRWTVEEVGEVVILRAKQRR